MSQSKVFNRALVSKGHRVVNAGNLNCVHYQIVALTNGTTSVNVFGTNGAPAPITIQGVYLISNDTTAGNITVAVPTGTVATIAKGTVAGVLVGGTTPITYNTAKENDAVTIVSSSGGNASVVIIYSFNAV
jgi:hypothetical protein